LVFCRLFPLLKAIGIVACFQDIAVMSAGSGKVWFIGYPRQFKLRILCWIAVGEMICDTLEDVSNISNSAHFTPINRQA
jgi:hypothetical protein